MCKLSEDVQKITEEEEWKRSDEGLDFSSAIDPSSSKGGSKSKKEDSWPSHDGLVDGEQQQLTSHDDRKTIKIDSFMNTDSDLPNVMTNELSDHIK